MLPHNDAPINRIRPGAALHWAAPATAVRPRVQNNPPPGPSAVWADTKEGLPPADGLTNPENHFQLVAKPTDKHSKHHVCVAPPHPNPPLPSLPAGFKRQPVHGGLTIEAMTHAVIAALDKHKYTYELPEHYSVLRPNGKVLECSFQPRHPQDYNVPRITFTEAPGATFVWYGNRLDVKTLEEIAAHIERCHAKFEIDRHENWEHDAIDEHLPQITDLIGKIMLKASQKIQDNADSRKRIFDKIHKAVAKAFKSEVTPLKRA